MGEPNPPRRRMKALDATAREMVELEAGRAEAEQRKAAIGRYDDVRAPQQSVPRKQREGSEGTAARMGSWTQGRRRNRSGRPQRAGAPSTWKWVLGAVVVALVIWQVAQGVFVKSFSMLGVDVSFQNPNADSTNDGNKVYQSDVSDSAVKIIGRDNFVKQTRGTGNSATIGR